MSCAIINPSLAADKYEGNAGDMMGEEKIVKGTAEKLNLSFSTSRNIPIINLFQFVNLRNIQNESNYVTKSALDYWFSTFSQNVDRNLFLKKFYNRI